MGSASWVANLPESIEAFFYLDCDELQHKTLDYIGGGGLAENCEDAEDYVRAAHATYLEAYGLDQLDFPLLTLRTSDWHAPFALAPEPKRPVKAMDQFGHMCVGAGAPITSHLYLIW